MYTGVIVKMLSIHSEII